MPSFPAGHRQNSELPFTGVLIPAALAGGPLARHAPGPNP